MRIALPLAALALLLAGCAASPGSAGGSTGGSGSSNDLGDIGVAIAAPGEVIGQGTVLQLDDEQPQLCLGPVAESYPPQCAGIPLDGWTWEGVDHQSVVSDAAEGGTSSQTTWGTYAVTGTWDGTTFTTTSAVSLALYDPLPFVDPLVDPENAGDTAEAELLRIQTELTESAPFALLGSYPQNGYLFADVVYDDGSIQAWVDEKYLPDTVAIRSALHDIES